METVRQATEIERERQCTLEHTHTHTRQHLQGCMHNETCTHCELGIHKDYVRHLLGMRAECLCVCYLFMLRLHGSVPLLYLH